MKYDNFDEEYEGQMSIDDLYPEPRGMFAVSEVFVRARKQMTAVEYKAFVYALSHIDWTKTMPGSIEMDKKKLAKAIGIEGDANHLSLHLHKALKEISVHSYTEFKDQDQGLYISGTVINTLILNKRNKAILDINPRYASLFSELSSDYLTMWSYDIFNLRSERSITFYEHLRACSDTTKQCQKGFGVKALKELLNLSPDSYMRPKSGFNRSQFEKRVLEPLCEDMSRCEMIKLVIHPDGKYYEKVRDGKKVLGYRFYWTVSDRPRIAKAGEIKEIRDNIAKDPKTLKIAKDLALGKKRPKKTKEKSNTFIDFPQNTYNFDELESKLLDN